MFSHFTSGCFFLAFFLPLPLVELFFIVSRDTNLLQAHISLTIWSSHPITSSVSYVSSPETALWFLLIPIAVPPGLAGVDAPAQSSVQAEWWSRDLRSPSTHCAGKFFDFLSCFSFASWKTPLDPPAFYFWLLLFTKEKGQTWTSRSLCLGAVIFGGACLAWNDFGSNVHLIFRKHKSHANHAHPVDVYIQRPPFFHNVQKKGNESQNTTSMSWTDCKSLPILDQRNFWLWVLDPSELVATFPLTPVALNLSLGRLCC